MLTNSKVKHILHIQNFIPKSDWLVGLYHKMNTVNNNITKQQYNICTGWPEEMSTEFWMTPMVLEKKVFLLYVQEVLPKFDCILTTYKWTRHFGQSVFVPLSSPRDEVLSSVIARDILSVHYIVWHKIRAPSRKHIKTIFFHLSIKPVESKVLTYHK